MLVNASKIVDEMSSSGQLARVNMFNDDNVDVNLLPTHGCRSEFRRVKGLGSRKALDMERLRRKRTNPKDELFEISSSLLLSS
ncbi:hypothetical protein AAC387_Pa06g2052 [Persea americana]